MVYDTTLRDGLQQHGLQITTAGALRLAQAIAPFVGWIEAGFASSDQASLRRIQTLASAGLPCRVAAFGRTRGPKELTASAVDLNAIVASGAQTGTMVVKSRLQDVERSLRTTPAVNLVMLKESIDFLKQRGLKVGVDFEHFFDAVRSDADYALEVLNTAVAAGADWFALCDTNGGSTSSHVRKWIEAASEIVDPSRLSFHGHNDRGRAVANAEAAIEAGVGQIQGTMLGIGERCGNTDWMVLAPNVHLDQGIELFGKKLFPRLCQIAQLGAELLNITVGSNHPWVGPLANHTDAGMHASGMERDTLSYCHADPSLVGNRLSFGLSSQSGKASLRKKARDLGFVLTAEQVELVQTAVTAKIAEGYVYQAADASLILLILRTLGLDHGGEVFDLEEWRCIVGQGPAQAVLRASFGGKSTVEVGEGNGPVDALHHAVSKVLEELRPGMPPFSLADYRPRPINLEAASAAMMMVEVDWQTGSAVSFTTVGVSTDIINASLTALLDATAYAAYLYTGSK